MGASVSPRQLPSPNQLAATAVRIFAASERINQLLLRQLNPAAWSASLPSRPRSRVRTIAAIFTHLHNVRTKWIRLSAPHLDVPAQLNRARCTPQQARAALAESAARCAQMLAEALDGSQRVETFWRDRFARSWPPGPEMLCYMICHEAHHRGQVCMLAHQLGFPLQPRVTAQMWSWERLLKPFPVFTGEIRS
jgi:uncharacterized damage-inducible protein DinB